jgi:predicted glycogen debranching enzyme
MIELGKNIVTDFEESTKREWLETNGLGGYASGAISGANTRRYHGLLVAAAKPPLGRVVVLSKYDETVVIDGERFDISSNQYPDTIHPTGYKFLERFRLDPFPIWSYRIGTFKIEKKVFMVHGENSTVVSWSVKGRRNKRNVTLEVRPFVAFRDFHQLLGSTEDLETHFEIENGMVTMQPSAQFPRLFLNSNALSIERTEYWYRNFEYSIERERGFDYTENLFQPCMLTFDLAASANVIASTQRKTKEVAIDLEKAELKRRARLIARSGRTDDFSCQLVAAADQFIVDRADGKTVIAGYHWFSDWGRDTMIALPGLTLATNRTDVAKSVLLEFSKHISEGMLPNRFPDEGEIPEYNTVDATLWFFEAIRAYAETTGDYDLVREQLYEKLVEIIDWHVRGTRYRIHVDSDGLLYAGEPGVQLTWMDAKIGDWVVTPRTGKAVEIQALWYNALCIMADLASRFGDAEGRSTYASMAELAKESFGRKFWNYEQECLFDVINGDELDASIRPNQIFAVSLPHSLLTDDKARKVVEKVESELLTPVGLRSLSPNDPRYVASYVGSPFDRDASYHQGTVWGWLIGPFIDAYRKTHPDSAHTEKRINEIIDGFRDHLTEAMVGQISEIFDADPAHAPRGCAAQAWSVAELLRVLEPESNKVVGII